MVSKDTGEGERKMGSVVDGIRTGLVAAGMGTVTTEASVSAAGASSVSVLGVLSLVLVRGASS